MSTLALSFSSTMGLVRHLFRRMMGCFFTRKRYSAFGESLAFEADLAETQISTVTIVHRGDSLCALKVICFPKERRAAVKREAEAQRLAHAHPHILTLLVDEIVPTSNPEVLEARFLFPFYPGGTLAEAMQQRQSGMPEREALQVFTQIASAIAHCHSVGVTHRDLKLTNVYSDGATGGNGAQWVLGDFGSALLTASLVRVDDRQALMDARDEVIELTTPEYRAPEQVTLELGSEVGSHVDVWALGVCLHQICFNCNPFAAPIATLSDRVLTSAELSASSALRALMAGLLERDPAARLSASAACAAAQDVLVPSVADVEAGVHERDGEEAV